MDLYLEPKEMELLQHLLAQRLEDLQRAIHHTDSRSYRAELKTDEALLAGILAKVKAPQAIGI